MNGKGDTYRSVDKNKYDKNYNYIYLRDNIKKILINNFGNNKYIDAICDDIMKAVEKYQ